MCIKGNKGIKIGKFKSLINKFEYLFAEDQGRYIVEIKESNKDEVSNILKKNSVFFEIIGKTQKDSLDINKDLSVKINELINWNSFWFKSYFNED